MSKLITISTALVLFSSSYAQNEASNCYFGNIGIDFRTAPPTIDENSGMIASESTATICDQNGNLLFYSNGGNSPTSSGIGAIWNRNHEIMENGELIDSAGCHSSYSGCVAIPFPDDGTGANNGLYYLFAKDCIESNASNANSGLTYAVIDMNQNGGLGKVISKYNTILPYDGVTSGSIWHEPIAAIQHENGNDYWLFTYYNGMLTRLAITSSGIGSSLGSYTTKGVILISPSKNHLLAGNRLYQLNASTGAIQFIAEIPGGLAGAFSPDGSKLYMKEGTTMYQYNTTAANVLTTRIFVTDMNNFHRFFLAPNGRIYFHYSNANELRGHIECPNSSVPQIGVNLTPLSLGSTGSAGIQFTNLSAHLLYGDYVCNLDLTENQSEKLTISPNPTHDFIQLKNAIEYPVKLDIYSLNGSLLETHSIDCSECKINLSHLSAGSYLFKITSSSYSFMEKIMVL
jgi:hypothetical protein